MILRNVLKCKIHRAIVTHADLDYEGSITIPDYLMKASELAEYEAVHVWNVTNGNRLQTYAITGEPNANTICMNGAAAHLITPGDMVIIAAFQSIPIPTENVSTYKPKLVFVDSDNQIKSLDTVEIAGPAIRN
ncbi:UNVERIFIED_CONTAM: hypothetical protein GTU68_063677 [Idotea baltica]|nr:hypothetical protein [Idotea baltica]